MVRKEQLHNLILPLCGQVIIGSARNMYKSCVEGMNFEEFFEGKCVIFLFGKINNLLVSVYF